MPDEESASSGDAVPAEHVPAQRQTGADAADAYNRWNGVHGGVLGAIVIVFDVG